MSDVTTPAPTPAVQSAASANQIIASSLLRLFTVLSKPDNMKVFLAAKDGIKVQLLTSLHLQLSRKQYYKALKQLKDIGLIEKFKNVYYHTSFGKIVYQKNIIDLAEYTRYSDGMQVLDTIKRISRGGCSDNTEDKFMSFIEKLTNIGGKTMDSGVGAITSPITSKKVELVWTYEEMLSSLLQRIDLCKEEILIATRVSPEAAIKTIQQKSKEGSKIRVLADEDLIREYFKLHKTNDLDLESKDKNDVERMKVISNPWYPEEKNIERKICKVPFGMIIIDGKEVGIEIIDQSDPHKSKACILLTDENIGGIMRKYYQKIWDNAYSDFTQLKEQLIDKEHS